MSTAAASFEVIDGGRLSNAQRNEARLFALQIVRDPAVRTRLLEQARSGRLPPPIMLMLFHYAYGKPPDRLEIGRGPDLSELSEEQLMARIEAVKSALNGESKTLTAEGAAAAEPVAQAILTKKALSLVQGED
jgi:hypothetical protein